MIIFSYYKGDVFEVLHDDKQLTEYVSKIEMDLNSGYVAVIYNRDYKEDIPITKHLLINKADNQGYIKEKWDMEVELIRQNDKILTYRPIKYSYELVGN